MIVSLSIILLFSGTFILNVQQNSIYKLIIVVPSAVL